MLRFLRRYQKIIFAIIAFFIIITFSFFGTQSVISDIKKTKDKDVALAYDGTKIKLSEIENLSLFLATDFEDANFKQSGILPNLFNDGVIRKDILQFGLAKIFFEKYFEVLKPALIKKFEKAQKYTPFVHFYDSSISLESIWEKYNPQILTLLKQIKTQKECDLNFLNLYIELYNQQNLIRPEYLRNILIFLERQKNVQSDPRLYQDTIALFGFDNALDWFGKDFLDLVSQFIINSAKVANEKGYEVTNQEALSDLMINLKKALSGKTNQYSQYFKKMLSILKMDEKKAAKTWKNVMLFRRYFQDISNNTLIDDLTYKEFSKFTRTKADVKIYKLPEYLQIKSFEDLLHFEMYLLATADKKNVLDVPYTFKNVLEIEKDFPELIERKYSLNIKHTNLEKAATKVKIKDMYFWQLEDKNFDKLRSRFLFLSKAVTKQEKLAAIEKLSFDQKYQIDNFSRIEIVKEKPSYIDESLNTENQENHIFYIRSKNTTLNLPINDVDKFIELIDKNERILKYSEDNKNYFFVEVLQKSNEKYLVPFEKALKEKIINVVLDRYLNEKYQTLKSQHTIFQEADDFKSFDEVKFEVAKIVFADIIKKLKSLNLSKEQSLDAVSRYRFYSYVEDILNKLTLDEKYNQKEESQFKIICKNHEINRSKNPLWIEKTAFSMQEKKYSSLNVSDDGNIEFIYLNSIKDGDIPLDKIELAKNAISYETSSILARKLLKIFLEKKCIEIPLIKEIDKDV